MIPILAPSIDQSNPDDQSYRPSWPGPAYVNDEHRAVFEATKTLPGWQDPADSEKLYELAFHNGSVILEIGVFGGRSAVVELRGALAGAAARSLPPPQLYGVDVDPGFFARSFKTIDDAGLAPHALLFHGDLRRFHREIPITPTMVFVDGDHRYPGVWADLECLRTFLAPGTPVMCHDYGGIEGVRRAIDQWIDEGSYLPMGRFAGSILLRVAPRGRALPAGGRGLSPEKFEAIRSSLIARYQSPRSTGLRRDKLHSPSRDLTLPARQEILGPSAPRVSSARAGWPYAAPDQPPLPPTMPGGHPWPRISVITPSFNQGKYIEETILSVLHQGYPNLEYIVMDGASTDETLAVLERYRPRMACCISEPDKGQCDAINKGFSRATGDILTWLNSDDMLAPGALAAVALAFHQSGADMVAGECRIYRDGVLSQRHITSCDNGTLPLEELLDIDGCWLEGRFFYQPEVMFTRALWDKAGGQLDLSLYHSLDYDLWLRFAEQGAKLHVIGRPIALFRAHPEQKTAGKVVGGFRVELPKARDAFLARTGRPAWSGPARPKRRRSRLRVALLSDLGYAYGAGIAHRRLASAFAEAGHEVAAVAAGTHEPMREVGRATIGDTIARLEECKPDLVVVGNLHGADLDAALLDRVASRFPTAFVMHDLWLLTGRCAYTGGCRKYITAGGCGPECTCDPRHPKLDPQFVHPAWQAKRRVISGSPDLALWANSRWALARAEEALGATGPGAPLRPPQQIRFGLELDTFRPRDKAVCRELLGLPPDAFIIMSSASSLADERKGLRHLAQAMDLLNIPDSLVACVGWFGPKEQPPIPGMRAMGYIDEPQRLAMLYSAADLFVGPSLEEAFGQVFIEAAACGTPSIGYPVGGVPEAILDGVSGRIADSVSPAALADAIDELYRDRELRLGMSRWARIWAENEWSLVSSYHRIFGALRRQGLASQLGLGPKIDLALAPPPPPRPVLVPTTLPAWRAVSGFGPWEGPYPERALPRARWAYGPAAAFTLDAPSACRARILISYRSFERNQRIRMVCAGRAVGERDVPLSRGGTRDRILSFEADLAQGPNPVELHFWRWRLDGARPLALLVTSITSVPLGAPHATAGAIEAKPAAAPTPLASRAE